MTKQQTQTKPPEKEPTPPPDDKLQDGQTEVTEPEEVEEEEEELSTEGEEEEEESSDGETSDEKVARLEEENRKIRIALKRANKEAKERRLLLKDQNKKTSKATGEDEETESVAQLRSELERANSKLRKVRIESAVARVAGRLNVAHPELVVPHIDMSEVEEDEDTGEFVGLESAVRAVLKRYPELGVVKKKKPAPADIDATKQGKSGGVQIDDAAIAQQFGLRIIPSKK